MRVNFPVVLQRSREIADKLQQIPSGDLQYGDSRSRQFAVYYQQLAAELDLRTSLANRFGRGRLPILLRVFRLQPLRRTVLLLLLP